MPETSGAAGTAPEWTTEDKRILLKLLGALLGVLDGLCGCGIKYHWGPVVLWATFGIAETLVGGLLAIGLMRQGYRKMRGEKVEDIF